ncbi:MAG TPA: metalloregulator ArsR/SmtB family transcription factor [Intrasporangium sp.]|uniref:ArsR/SmtB family transcription factor n=1 Tax=Intrasporangium sp. TaxID=1925024 RepID=UPI002D792504|nr:metalloregulator ArsR/SmtB family transcription factor [Intrasporangium sp.]HET7397222.1 metalloregulator ArsR/SmtB family transcription factor [Intrasporangium sp.]
MTGPDLLVDQPTRPTGVSACGTALASPMPRAVAEERSALLKAVADPVRLQLLSLIASSPRQEACVCDMTQVVGVSQPTVSHHLKVLVEAGVLTRARRGTWAWFTLVPRRLEDITRIFG